MIGCVAMGLLGAEVCTWAAEEQESAKSTKAESKPAEFYEPVLRDVEGWRVKLDPQLIQGEHAQVGKQALAALANHLQRVKYIVRGEQLRQLKRLPIWVELANPRLGAMQYHPSEGWLKKHGHDPALAKHVHLPQANQLFDRKMWAKHPYVVLHELAHAYHDQVLGFEYAPVRDAYEQAKAAKIYERVLLYTGKQVEHYGLTNHKEYFAEATEAFFGVNDFYPFVRAELQQHDPRMFRVLEEVWGGAP